MSPRAGMTLLELMVGLAIMGSALAAGYGAFAGVADQRERAVKAMDAAAREALVRRTIVEWLRGARLTVDEGGPPFSGLDGTHGAGPDDELSFLTTAPTPAGSGEAMVRLFIDRDKETLEEGLVAVIGEWRGTGAERIELVPGATGLDARYLFGFRGHRWLPSWISTSVLPLGVELVVTGESPEAVPPLLRHPIRVAIGASR